MNSRLLVTLLIVSAAIVLTVAWRLYAIYRRRRRWKMLTTTHSSLYIARGRIVAPSELPDED
jgi:uncharacterized membrane protein YidH (DUF202 family)